MLETHSLKRGRKKSTTKPFIAAGSRSHGEAPSVPHVACRMWHVVKTIAAGARSNPMPRAPRALQRTRRRSDNAIQSTPATGASVVTAGWIFQISPR